MFAATIGFFDGVHRGHRHVFGRLCDIARSKGLQTMAVTFGNHPMEVIRPGSEPQLLLSIDEKIERIKACGIDEVVVLKFTRGMMQQPAREFMEQVLRDDLGVSLLLIGYDNRFGRRNPEENFEVYSEYGRQIGIEVVEGPRPEECGMFEGRAISSSLIRQLMQEGRETEARKLMNNE